MDKDNSYVYHIRAYQCKDQFRHDAGSGIHIAMDDYEEYRQLVITLLSHGLYLMLYQELVSDFMKD